MPRWPRLTCGSLFSGIGGFDLGLERAGFEIAWQVENNDYCRRVLRKHWPSVPCHYDIRTIEWEYIQRVDVVCGGFPCQPVSLAGLRLAQDDERWLWPEFLRCIRVLRPRYVLIENVPGLLTAGLGDIISGLAASGYDAEWDCIPASAVGAPHRRDRVFTIAVEGWRCPADEWREPSRGEIGDNAILLPDTDTLGCQKQRQPIQDDAGRQLGRVRTQYSSWWASEPAVGRVVDGFPGRVDRLKALGNAIVPQIAEALGRMILEAEKEALCVAPNVVA
jgi:DNA (cytosine-5)-methyltransferase 1